MLYLKNATEYVPPEILFVGINSLHEGILQLEYETGLHVNDDDTLNAITNCIHIEQNAKIELDYYCLNLADKYCYGNMYPELDMFLKFLIDYGNELLTKIQAIGLYCNGVFPYAYTSRRYNTVRFLRKDVLYKQIKQELKEDGY